MAEPMLKPYAKRPKRGRRADFPRLLGGNLCLNFVNTIEGRRGPRPIEFLHSYEDVVRWGEHVSELDPSQAEMLLEVAKSSPERAAVCFARAIELREALHQVFLAQAHNTQPPQGDIDRLKHTYITALSHAKLSHTPQGYEWRWTTDEFALEAMLGSVAFAAVELLCSSDLRRIKECPGADDCGWLFFDASRNRSRRWCSMEGCGSRVKMRRHYARNRNR